MTTNLPSVYRFFDRNSFQAKTKMSELKMSTESAALLKQVRKRIREMFIAAMKGNIFAKDKDSFDKFKNLHADAREWFTLAYDKAIPKNIVSKLEMYELCLCEIEKKWWPEEKEDDNGKLIQKNMENMMVMVKKDVQEPIQERKSLASCTHDDKIQLRIYDALSRFPKIKSENDLKGLKKAVKTTEQICSALSKIPTIGPNLFPYLRKRISEACYPKLELEIVTKALSMSDILTQFINQRLYSEHFAITQPSVQVPQSAIVNLNALNFTRYSMKCQFCRGDHYSCYCTKEFSDQEKLYLMIKKCLCWRCLRPNHRSEDCQNCPEILCLFCQGMHRTDLHRVWLFKTNLNIFLNLS